MARAISQEPRHAKAPATEQFPGDRNLSGQNRPGARNLLTARPQRPDDFRATGICPVKTAQMPEISSPPQGLSDRNLSGHRRHRGPGYAEFALITSRAMTRRWISLVPS